MGRMYTATFNNIDVSSAQDLFELVAPADAIVVLHDIHLSQNSDVGDTEEEVLCVELTSGYTLSGSGGSSVTPVPILLGDAAFGGTCEVNNTTRALSGTIVTHAVWNWNIRVGFDKVFTPETRPILSPSRRMCLGLPIAPNDTVIMSGTITFEEIGG